MLQVPAWSATCTPQYVAHRAVHTPHLMLHAIQFNAAISACTARGVPTLQVDIACASMLRAFLEDEIDTVSKQQSVQLSEFVLRQKQTSDVAEDVSGHNCMGFQWAMQALWVGDTLSCTIMLWDPAVQAAFRALLKGMGHGRPYMPDCLVATDCSRCFLKPAPAWHNNAGGC